jgi:drug/metabolite transporter (DMT)-like permease
MSRWPSRLPHPALIFVVFAWGLNFVALKYTLNEWPVHIVMLLRYFLMGMVMGGYAWALKLTYKPEKKEWPRFLFTGFLSSGLYMVLFLEGMDRVGAAQGAVCLATSPIWVSILAVLIGQEKGRWQLFVGGLLAYSGVAAVILMGSGERHWTPEGLVYVLSSAFVWSISVVMMKPLLKDRPAVGVFTATFPGAVLILLPYTLYKIFENEAKHGVSFHFSQISWVGWCGLAYLTLIAGFGAFTAYYVGVREVGAPKTSMIAYFVPVVAAISAWIIRGEALNILQMVGIIVLLLGVWLASNKSQTSMSPAIEIADKIG